MASGNLRSPQPSRERLRVSLASWQRLATWADSSAILQMRMCKGSQTCPNHARSGEPLILLQVRGQSKWSPGPFVAAITGRTLPQLVLLFADQWWQPGTCFKAVQTGPGQSIAGWALSPGPTVAATSGLGELANIDLQVVRVQAVLFNNRTTGKLQVQFTLWH